MIATRIAHTLRRLRRQPRPAQSLVEFALVAPLLLTLVVGLLELGIVFSIYIGLTNAAREGARAGAVYQWTGATPTNAQANSQVPTIDAARASFVRTAITNTRIPIVADSALTVPTPAYFPDRTTSADRQLNPLRAGDVIEVQIQYTHRVLWGVLGARDVQLQTRATARIEPGGGR